MAVKPIGLVAYLDYFPILAEPIAHVAALCHGLIGNSFGSVQRRFKKG